MAGRLRAAGLPAADVQVLAPAPRKGNLVARFRGTGARQPLLLLAHLDVVEARREDWSIDPFTLVEQDGNFYGRGTSDDKAMAAIFVDTLIRLKREGWTPSRDIILALTRTRNWARAPSTTACAGCWPTTADRRGAGDQRGRRRRDPGGRHT